MNDTEQQARNEYVAGLRALADVLEAHPEVDLPWTGTPSSRLVFYTLGQENSADQAVKFLKAFPGKLEKVYEDNTFRLRAALGGLHVELVTFRSDVCERVVTGTREVTRTVPAPDAPTVEVTETVEDVEWICAPLLAEAAS